MCIPCGSINTNHRIEALSPSTGAFSMAHQRFINTNFWKDGYIIELDPIEKLLFLYLLTNPSTSIAGIYEINVRQIAFDTGIDRDMVAKVIARFVRDGKVYYKNGWLALTNWVKHQSSSPKVVSGVQRVLDEIPEWLRKDLLEPNQEELPLLNDRVSIDYTSPIALYLTKLNYTKLNLTLPNAAKPRADMNLKNSGIDKKSYAKAVRADEALKVREHESRTRQPSKAIPDINEILGGMK